MIEPNQTDPLLDSLVDLFTRSDRGDFADVQPDPDRLESPLEYEMFFALLGVGFVRPHEPPGLGFVFQQLEVSTHRGDYRLDLGVVRRVDRFTLKLAVEVDGAEFHRAKAAQVERDCQRDRALVRAGWRVLRFPGSEVHRERRACVLDVAGVVIEWVDSVRRAR